MWLKQGRQNLNKNIITISTKEILEDDKGFDQSYLNYIQEQLIEFIRAIVKQKKSEGLNVAEIHKLTTIPHTALYSILGDGKYLALSVAAILRCLNKLGYEMEIIVSEKK